MQYRVILLQLFLLSGHLYSQSIVDKLKKEAHKGDELFNQQSYDEAILHYERALVKNPYDTRVKLQLAVCYNELDEWSASLNWFESVGAMAPTVITNEYAFQYADVLQHLGRFEESHPWYQRAKGHYARPVTLNNRLRSLENLEEYYRDSSRYRITALPFNTDAAEFSPSYYPGGLVFTSYTASQREQIPQMRSEVQYDLYFFPIASEEPNARPQELFSEINTLRHEGTLAVYDDHRQMIFTRGNEKSSPTLRGHRVKHLGLYHAEFDSALRQWTNVMPLSINDSDYSLGHPAISADGKKLYFISDMPDGFGGTDIYVSEFVGGEWSTPLNLGSTVNSDADELFPYVHQDSILYFASEGHPGLGGLDIYKTTVRNDTVSEVVNVGYPINSTGDDFGIIINPHDSSGFFTSNRPAAYLRDNIYQFDHVEPAPPESELTRETFTLQGAVVDKEDNAPLANTKVTLLDLESRRAVEVVTDSVGWFMAKLPSVSGYFIRAEKNKFFTYKATIPGDTLVVNNLYHTIEMEAIKIGQTFLLDNMYYDVGAYEVNDKNRVPLDEVVELLEDNATIRIELSSHTDSRGSDKFNLSLSQKRAKAAAEYIMNQGIDIGRLKAVGYGETKMVFPCGDEIDCDEEQHLMNRRTEITILDH